MLARDRVVTVDLGLVLLWMLAWCCCCCSHGAESGPTRILLDTDVDSDDVFAILYLLKQDPARVSLKAITISANDWSDAGHAVNLVYDLLHMMGRDDIPVGVGGEGGITYAGKFSSNVGGYLPLIEQGLSTWGGCRYRQAIPPGSGGLLDIDTMFGIRKQFLPQGKRHYEPLKQPTAQEVMLDVLSEGPTVVILIGSHTNFATVLMTHPEVKQNVERIYVMGGGVKSHNPTGCCPKGSPASCVPSSQCGDRGNLFDAIDTNPWAEFNMFSDPFAAYEVFHSGIPITLVPLDATNTIPISKRFFSALEENQHTYEAQWVYQVLKITKETWSDDNFYKEDYLWDSFTSGVAVSGILTNHSIKKNKYCVLHYRNVTVVTSNKPYGAQDGSNSFFDNRTVPRFHLQKGGIHSGHVQTGLQDSFCLVPGKRGKCMDGYTMESSAEGAKMQVGASAKPNSNAHDDLEFTFQTNFIERLNAQKHAALYNFETQFPCYKEVLYKAQVPNRSMGKSVIFDMDISPGDIITLLYLLKLPRKIIDLKAITVSATGWSNAATIDIVYDILHMMGRDDIPVGLGEFFAVGQAYLPSKSTGDCKYRQWIPNGAGGFIDSDTLFGLARDLPRSPRRYTAENSVKFGAPRNTDHPELRQPTAQEVIEDVLKKHHKKERVSFLTGGPLTNIATFLTSNSSLKFLVKEIFIAGGSIGHSNKSKHLGNVYTLPENTRSEFNFFLDPQAAQKTLESDLKTYLIPLDALHETRLVMGILDTLNARRETPEARFVHKLLLKVHQLELQSGAYAHTEKLLEEVLAAVALVQKSEFQGYFEQEPVVVMSSGNVSTDGWTKVDHGKGKTVHFLGKVNPQAISKSIAKALNSHSQSAVVASFAEQVRSWTTCN